MSTESLMQIFSQSSPDAIILLKKSDLIEFAEHLLKSREDSRAADQPADEEWLNAKDISKRFGLAYNNVKSAKWRKEHGFPSHQPGGTYSTPMFCVSEVSNWLRNE